MGTTRMSSHGCWVMTPSSTSANNTPTTISGVRWLGRVLALAPPATATDDPERLKMATRIQIGSHSPQLKSVSTACSAWLGPPPEDTATEGGAGALGGGVGPKCRVRR